MHRPRRLCPAPAAAILLALALFFCCAPARAEVQSANLVDQVLQEYQQAAKGWESVLLDEAKTTFWELATISLVVTVCWMLLRGADLMALTAELVGFVVMTLFFWWLLTNGPSFGQAIVNGLRLLGSRGSGTDQALYPSQVLDIGFRIYSKAVSELSLYLLGQSTLVAILAVVALLCTALIAVNVIMTLSAAWILTYAGIIYLGFGGSRWTSDLAIGFYRGMLGIGMSLMTMAIIVNIAYTFLDKLVGQMGDRANLGTMGALMVALLVVAFLSNSVPKMVGQLATGVHHGVGNLSFAASGMFALSTAGLLAGGVASAAVGGASKAAQSIRKALEAGPYDETEWDRGQSASSAAADEADEEQAA